MNYFGSVALLSNNTLKWSAILGLSFFVQCWWPRESVLWGSNALSKFRSSLSKGLTLGHCVKVKQRYPSLLVILGWVYPFWTWFHLSIFSSSPWFWRNFSPKSCARSRGISFLVFLLLMMCCLPKRLLLLSSQSLVTRFLSILIRIP